MYETMQKYFMPMLKSLGAVQCFEVQTSDTTVSIVAVNPDEATQRSFDIRTDHTAWQGGSWPAADHHRSVGQLDTASS